MAGPHRIGAAVAALLILAACGGADPAAPGNNQGNLNIFAASSLSEVFESVGDGFTAASGARVTLNLAGSHQLVTQILQGAPADVIATADEDSMRRLREQAAVEEPKVFARNTLRIAVATGNPKRIRALQDLSAEGLIVVLPAPEVPAGAYARQVLDRAGVKVSPRSLEQNVKAVVAKVSLGEADAGLVYASDVLAASDRIDGIDIPDDVNIRAAYPVAVVEGAANRRAAEEFIDFLLSPEGQRSLADRGFLPA